MNLRNINDMMVSYAEENPERAEWDFLSMLEYYDSCSASERTGCRRTYYLPKIFRESDVNMFRADMRILYSILRKITERFFADSEYRKLFRYDEKTERLILSDHTKNAFLPLARIDVFFNEDTREYKFCEFNADGSSCMNCDRELNTGQKKSSAYGMLEKKYRLRTEELFDSWVTAAMNIYRRVRGTVEKPNVIITDYLEGGYVNEFHVFADHFRKSGCGCEVCDVRNLRYDNGALYGETGFRADMVYRRAVTSDVLLHYDESTALVRAFEDGAVVPLGGFHTQIAHSKVVFEVMFRPETRAFLTEEECRYIDAHVPVTKIYEPADREVLIREKDRWIVKPADGYASRGFYAGLDHTDDEWKKRLDEIPYGRYVMQEFVMPYASRNVRHGRTSVLYNLTGIYLYDGEYAGLFSRVSPWSTCLDVEMLPTVIVDDTDE